MPRIRSIKPSFFLNDALAGLSPMHRLLFIGLWTQADRLGLVADNPRRLRAALFPYEECDVDKMIDDLMGLGFVVRYVDAKGQPALKVINFAKHQKPHPKEPAGELTEPVAEQVLAVEKNGKTVASRVVSGLLSLGSGLLSLENANPVLPGQTPASAPADPAPPGSELQALWNEAAGSVLPQWQETGKKRAAAVRLRLSERPLEQWREVVTRIRQSPFCCGENDRGWRANPDWLLKPGTAAKVMEGQYDGKSRESRPKHAHYVGAEEIDHSKSPGGIVEDF